MKEKIVEIIVDGLREAKAKDICIVDMTEIEDATFSYFVICEGTSTTHVQGIADETTAYVKKHGGGNPYGAIGRQHLQWVAIDYGHVLVHVFLPEARRFYRLESLWADAELTTISTD